MIDPRKELEADQYALDILWEAGFDPRAMLEIAKRLPAHSSFDFGQPENWRVLAIQNRLRDSRFVRSGIQDSNEFRRLRDKIRNN
ncbi:hypothetical protein [Methylocaldum sp.]|uniref:hypothetical protein n=1 Tax=Methylocaldum sp. TaxID=1969727 RepID=UPI002D519CB9|nr:hypothetical protein [Methylocaldum sp.]HYE35736.1 hypothetical protein [Methylocaldum sp.]